MSNKKYAVIQDGYGAFGVGDTPDAAVTAAAEWLCDENGFQGISVASARALVDEGRSNPHHGCITMIDSDDEEWGDYVEEDGK